MHGKNFRTNMFELLSASVLKGSRSMSCRSPLGPVTVTVSVPVCIGNSYSNTQWAHTHTQTINYASSKMKPEDTPLDRGSMGQGVNWPHYHECRINQRCMTPLFHVKSMVGSLFVEALSVTVVVFLCEKRIERPGACWEISQHCPRLTSWI